VEAGRGVTETPDAGLAAGVGPRPVAEGVVASDRDAAAGAAPAQAVAASAAATATAMLAGEVRLTAVVMRC
jgi:hypothetical protein